MASTFARMGRAMRANGREQPEFLRTHPVTLDGEVRGVPGLYVADGSLFPSSVGVPPQVTIMTLATLIARRLAASRPLHK